MTEQQAPAPAHPEWHVTPEQIIEFDANWLLFWADPIVASQLEIWLPYLRRSRYRFVIASASDRANPGVARLLGDFPNVMMAMPYESVTAALRRSRHFKGVLYPTTRPANFTLITIWPVASHVWIGHGESEKGVNGPRTATLYDSVFMARYSAVERFPPAIRSWVASGACAIGAPVVDGVLKSPWPAPKPVKTVIYAPTWEGRRPGMDYSSLPGVVPILRDAMPALRERGINLILRPHPGTGQRDPSYRALVNELFEAGASRPGPKADDFAAADVMLSDISGVTAEWLFTEKPVLLPVTDNTIGRGRDESMVAGEYPWTYRWHVDTEDLLQMLDGLATSDPLRGQRAASAKSMYRGHSDIDEAVRTFDLALSCVDRRERRIGVRLAFEIKARSRIGRGLMRRIAKREGRRPRRRHAAVR